MEAQDVNVDEVVGRALRRRRQQHGMSQAELGASVDLGFQQIRKYERGESSISASKLWRFCKVLDVPVTFFFEDLIVGEPTRPGPGRDASELQFLFDRIERPNVRKMLLELAREIATLDTSKR